MTAGSRLTYAERANYCLSPLAKKTFKLIEDKQTNLGISADVTSAQALLELADKLGPHICVFKTHIDIIHDFTPALLQDLRQLAVQHQFMIFEDRKFADIGATVKNQYSGGIYQIANWADMVNAHTLPGPGIIEGLAEIGRPKSRGLILLAEMSSAGHLMDASYIKHTLAMAEQYADFVLGFITQHAVSKDPHWINFTPAIKLAVGTDGLGQQYATPELAITDRGADVIFVGRGITSAKDPVAEAVLYRDRAWQAYLKRLRT